MLPSQMRGNEEEKREGGEGRGARKGGKEGEGGREAKMAAGSREFI